MFRKRQAEREALFVKLNAELESALKFSDQAGKNRTESMLLAQSETDKWRERAFKAEGDCVKLYQKVHDQGDIDRLVAKAKEDKRRESLNNQWINIRFGTRHFIIERGFNNIQLVVNHAHKAIKPEKWLQVYSFFKWV